MMLPSSQDYARAELGVAYREAIAQAQPAQAIRTAMVELEGTLKTAGAPEWVPVLVREVLGKHVIHWREREREGGNDHVA